MGRSAGLNGDGMGYKTHSIVLMKGELDPLLKWPFEYKVPLRKHRQIFKPINCNCQTGFHLVGVRGPPKLPHPQNNLAKGFEGFGGSIFSNHQHFAVSTGICGVAYAGR